MIKIINGNIFASQCHTIVNTVNCVGVMGAGIALECKLRYPVMYEKYVELCREKQIKIGELWVYQTDKRWILNFPTKQHWRYPSKIEYLEKGLQNFNDTYKKRGIKSIAFPLLGSNNGGIAQDVSLGIMKQYLSECEIEVEIYLYDPNAYDDLYPKFKKLWTDFSEREIAMKSGLQINIIKKIKFALEDGNTHSFSNLMRIKGVGESSLQKSVQFVNKYFDNRQLILDFNNGA